MNWRVMAAITLVLSIGHAGYGQSTGMFCEPGSEWHSVASGVITEVGWSVVNFSKPAGGEVRVMWEYGDFDDGPATAGFFIGLGPEQIDGGGLLYTNDQRKTAHVQLDTTGTSLDQRLSTADIQGPVGYGDASAVTLGAPLDDPDVHIFQYAAGVDHDGWSLSWEILADSCVVEDPEFALASGTDAMLLTAEELRGTLNVHARAGASPALGPDGAAAFLDARVTPSVDGVPFVNIFWYNHAGEVELQGPGGVVLDDLFCPSWAWYTQCLGWGDWRGSGLAPGQYQVSITGFTDPTSDPTGPTRGPYILLVPTELPTRDEGATA